MVVEGKLHASEAVDESRLDCDGYANQYKVEQIEILWSDYVVVSWQEFEQENPELADFGRKRIDGKVAYLATISATISAGTSSGNGSEHSSESPEDSVDDIWPSVRPITPIIGAGKCFIFFDPDSKRLQDIERNNHFSLHCGMSDSSGSSGEFQMIGEARRIESLEERKEAESVSSFMPASRFQLFELMLCRVSSASYKGGRAHRQRWTAA